MAGTLHVDIVSPTGSIYKGDAVSVQAPGLEGSFAVLYNHAPMVATIAVGTLTVTDAKNTRIPFATSGGFLEVSGNRVTILAETAEMASKIDVERARSAEQRAQEVLDAATSEEERALYAAALERARNRLRVSMGHVGQHN
ncbi:MAG: ATP synthase F1 subunit epsilon [Rhodothermales bacterium]